MTEHGTIDDTAQTTATIDQLNDTAATTNAGAGLAAIVARTIDLLIICTMVALVMQVLPSMYTLGSTVDGTIQSIEDISYRGSRNSIMFCSTNSQLSTRALEYVAMRTVARVVGGDSDLVVVVPVGLLSEVHRGAVIRSRDWHGRVAFSMGICVGWVLCIPPLPVHACTRLQSHSLRKQRINVWSALPSIVFCVDTLSKNDGGLLVCTYIRQV